MFRGGALGFHSTGLNGWILIQGNKRQSLTKGAVQTVVRSGTSGLNRHIRKKVALHLPPLRDNPAWFQRRQLHHICKFGKGEAKLKGRKFQKIV
ncbi:hypothetical protein POVCU2_0038040 [Plasmodium ovale curtisi]|uniref:Uncharacterized protein n=1 Tax=Plasmodium ovale curtisi TaxID=864141 RepID=A0A1A8W125_PLAOA|nr:hypothetical protein POVCU2_0038040 [Plasmodium ovale curtisi]